MIVVGLGCRAGTPSVVLAAAVRAALAEAAVEPGRVTALATLDRRAAEDGVRALARDSGWRLIGFPAADLAAQPVPAPPSRAATAAVGTPSVAEAAALLATGRTGTLILGKRILSGVTVAIADAGARPGGVSGDTRVSPSSAR